MQSSLITQRDEARVLFQQTYHLQILQESIPVLIVHTFLLLVPFEAWWRCKF